MSIPFGRGEAWTRVGGISSVARLPAPDLCYTRLFELAPDTRALFPGDMDRQRFKLMDMIAALVGALDHRELFQSLITHSGRKHARFRGASVAIHRIRRSIDMEPRTAIRRGIH